MGNLADLGYFYTHIYVKLTFWSQRLYLQKLKIQMILTIDDVY